MFFNILRLGHHSGPSVPSTRYLHIPLDASRCLQMPSDTSKYLQMPPDTFRYIQISADASICLQIPPDTSRYLQTPPDASRYLQIPPYTYTYLQMPPGYHFVSKVNQTCVRGHLDKSLDRMPDFPPAEMTTQQVRRSGPCLPFAAE